MVEIITKRHLNSKNYVRHQVSNLHLEAKEEYSEYQVDKTKGIVVYATFKYSDKDQKSYTWGLGHFKFWSSMSAINNYTNYIKVGKQSFWYKNIIENVDRINALIQQEYLKDALEKL